MKRRPRPKYVYALATTSFRKTNNSSNPESITIEKGKMYKISNVSTLSSSIEGNVYFNIEGSDILFMTSNNFELLTAEDYREIKINQLLKNIKHEKRNSIAKSIGRLGRLIYRR